MRKKLVQFAVITSFVIPQAQTMAQSSPGLRQASPNSQNTNQKQGLSSTESFLDFMDDPVLNKLYINAQKKRLKTVGDLALEEFVKTDKVANEVSKVAIEAFNEDLQRSMTQNLLQEFLITKDSNPRLYHQLNRVMRAQGFSRAQIKNAQFFRKMGGVNADAYTASVDGVGFELLSGLDEIASPSELRGVMGHELGHIRSEHVFIGLLDSILQIQLVKELAGPDTASATADEILKWNHNWLEARTKLSLNASKKLGLSGGLSDSFVKLMSQADEKISQTFTDVDRIDSLKNYLDLKIATYSNMEINPVHLQLLTELRQKLEPNQVMRANLDQLMQIVSQVMNSADSRNMESSADNYGASVVKPSSGASTMDSKFAGAEIRVKLTTAQVKELALRTRAQVNLARKLNTREQYYDVIGGFGSGDHPYSNLRVLKQVGFDQNIDRIALANPFLRLVVLRDEASDAIANLRAAKPRSRAKTAVIKDLTERLSKVDTRISDLINDPRFKTGNPRVQNLLDFRLTELQMSRLAFESLQTEFGSPNSFSASMSIADKNEILLNIQATIRSNLKDPLLAKSLEAFKRETKSLGSAEPQPNRARMQRQSIVQQIEAAIEEGAGSDKIVVARTQLRQLTRSSDRISIDSPSTGIKDSNTDWDDSAPPFKGEEPRTPKVKAVSKAMSCQALF